MAVVAGRKSRSPAELAEELQRAGLPMEELSAHPVSAIECFTGRTGADTPIRAVCAVRCLACCANSLEPERARSTVSLTAESLARFLSLVRHLAASGIHILSTDRLNLFSGTNECDHTECVPIRETLAACLLECYGIELGAIASDIVFHVSEAEPFFENLEALMQRPRLWNHVCFSIDEQVPFRDAFGYREYLERIAAAWRIVKPALARSLEHAKGNSGRPRVIVNMLVPDESSCFAPQHRQLYPGGPDRASSHEELIERYVRPFCGELRDVAGEPPADHRFTTGYGALRGVPESLVYVARCHYAPTGRGKRLVIPGTASTKPRASAIRTKLLPAGDGQFVIRACFTTGPASEDELPMAPGMTPQWFGALHNLVIDVRNMTGAGIGRSQSI